MAAISSSSTKSPATASNNDLPFLLTRHDGKNFVILLATGIAARAVGVWDNSYFKTASVGFLLGAAYGMYQKATNKNPRPYDLNLKDAATAIGALGISLSLFYSISVEAAFQSISTIGSLLAVNK